MTDAPDASGNDATGGDSSQLSLQTPIWSHRDHLPTRSPLPGVTMAPLTGDRLMVVFVTLEPGAIVPRHAHHHEQAGTILEGSMAMTIGEETRSLAPGDAYMIPPHVPHAATAGDHGCLVLDVFSPPRDDYRIAAP